jgi:lipopolysaccharide export LptBFGC system permease protein LptF
VSDRLPGRLLERIAARLAPLETYERVLKPLLADLQFEHGRAPRRSSRAQARVRGVCAFWSVLLPSLAQAFVWGATPEASAATRRRLVGLAWAVGIVVLAIFALTPAPDELSFDAQLLSVPSIVAVAIPVGALFASALAAPPERAPERRAASRVALAAGAATFAVAAWAVPAANQHYRQVAFRSRAHPPAATVTPGNRELTMGQLATRAAALRASRRDAEAAPLDVEWHKKPALGAACLLLALAGAAIAATPWGRTLRVATATALVVAFRAAFDFGEHLADAGHVSAAAGMWGPLVLLALAALALRFAWRPGARAIA